MHDCKAIHMYYDHGFPLSNHVSQFITVTEKDAPLFWESHRVSISYSLVKNLSSALKSWKTLSAIVVFTATHSMKFILLTNTILSLFYSFAWLRHQIRKYSFNQISVFYIHLLQLSWYFGQTREQMVIKRVAVYRCIFRVTKKWVKNKWKNVQWLEVSLEDQITGQVTNDIAFNTRILVRRCSKSKAVTLKVNMSLQPSQPIKRHFNICHSRLIINSNFPLDRTKLTIYFPSEYKNFLKGGFNAAEQSKARRSQHCPWIA